MTNINPIIINKLKKVKIPFKVQDSESWEHDKKRISKDYMEILEISSNSIVESTSEQLLMKGVPENVMWFLKDNYCNCKYESLILPHPYDENFENGPVCYLHKLCGHRINNYTCLSSIGFCIDCKINGDDRWFCIPENDDYKDLTHHHNLKRCTNCGECICILHIVYLDVKQYPMSTLGDYFTVTRVRCKKCGPPNT